MVLTKRAKVILKSELNWIFQKQDSQLHQPGEKIFFNLHKGK